MNNPGDSLSLKTPMSSSSCHEPVSNRYTPSLPPFDKPSPTSMGGTVFDLVQDRFWDCAGQRYRGTRNYRTSRGSGHIGSLPGISVGSYLPRISTLSPVSI